MTKTQIDEVLDEVKQENTIQEEEVVQEEELASLPEKQWVPERVTPEHYLSSGLTILNLACTNSPDCFIERGTYTLLVGHSSAGKSMLATQLLAEAANNPHFKDYELVYDDAEHGNLFDVRTMFGDKLADRIRPPREDEAKRPIYSAQVEDFFFNVDNLQDAKKPFVYILDSMDSLTSSQSDDKFEENKEERRKALEKGEDVKLTQGMGDGKAKFISQNLRRIVNRLSDTDSILVIICQVRENISGYGAKYVRAGGQALKFFAHQELWMYNIRNLTRTIDKKERQYGNISRADILKNRITGMKQNVEFPILMNVGISDMDCCLDWLVDEGKIIKPARSNGLYEYPDLNLKLNREAMIAKMEEDFEPFKQNIADTWYAILKAISTNRKRKYQ